MELQMELCSVNLGRTQVLKDGKGGARTGIYKEPTPHPVRLGELGLEGDAICSKKHHGGPDQAVYLYGLPDYDWWRELCREVEPGTFGENLTVAGLESGRIRVGDRFRIGEVVLEATGPRIPCNTLARRMGDSSFARRFRDAERPGVYCRVLRPGTVQVGQQVLLEPHAGETVTNLELYRDFFVPELTDAAIRRFLAAPIAIRARLHKEKQLRSLAPRREE